MTTTPQAPTFEISAIPDQKKADELTKELLAHDFEITDDDMYIASWPIVQKHDAVIAKLTKGEPGFVGFDGFVNGLHQLHKSAVQLREQFVGPLTRSKKRWLDRREAYNAKKTAEKKRADDAAAEILRKEAAKQLEKDARKFEKSGDVESAAVMREQAKTMPAPSIPWSRPLEKQAGEVEKSGWEFAVDDFEQVPDAYKLLDHTKKGERELIESKIRAVTSKLGDKIAIPGVRVWSSKSTSSRRV